MTTPWSCHAEREDDIVRISVMMSTDPGPMRTFREFLSIELDEAHACELLGTLAIALHPASEAAS